MDSAGLLYPRMRTGGVGRVPVRAIKTTTISILAVGLLAGSAVGVAAQETGQAYVTGSAVVSIDECMEAEGWNECPLSLDASDQRLTGEGTLRNADLPMPGEESFIILITQSLRVANEDGAWVGGGQLYLVPTEEDGAVGENEPTWVLTGEGSYEGLTAVLRPSFAEDVQFGGVIVEGVPPAAPPFPPAE